MKYKFSHFILTTDSKELSINGAPIDITKQLYDLLLLFVENPKTVFSKDDLINKVWKGRYVTENTIDQSVSKLRKLLNTTKKDQFIKTVYGKGFQFIHEVETIVENKNSTNKALHRLGE